MCIFFVYILYFFIVKFSYKFVLFNTRIIYKKYKYCVLEIDCRTFFHVERETCILSIFLVKQHPVFLLQVLLKLCVSV